MCLSARPAEKKNEKKRKKNKAEAQQKLKNNNCTAWQISECYNPNAAADSHQTYY